MTLKYRQCDSRHEICNYNERQIRSHTPVTFSRLKRRDTMFFGIDQDTPNAAVYGCKHDYRP